MCFQQLKSWFTETCVYRRIYTPLKSCITDSRLYKKLDSIRGKKELLFLSMGFVFFVIDLYTDIKLAVVYNRKGERGWFNLTLLCVVAPIIVISIMATYNAKGSGWVRLSVFLQSLLSSIFMRYVEEFVHWNRRYRDTAPCESCQGNYKECNCTDCKQYADVVKESNESAYELAWYRYVETIAESAPQWCLQVSIMLLHWDFPSLTVTSAVFSFFSLAMSITGLEKARVTNKGNDFKFLPHAVVYFTCQMLTLLSRLSAIVIFVYGFEPFILLFLLLHWMLMNWLYMLTNWYPKCDACHWIGCGILTGFPCLNIFTFPFLFHPTKAYYLWLEMGPDGFWYGCFHLLMSAENILMTTLVVVLPGSGVAHMNVMKIFALTFVIAGFLLGSILAVIYHCCLEDD